MKKITDFLFSTRLMSVVILVFAAAMAVATFVENDYGTQSAKALVYNAWWFELLMFLLMINFIGNIVKYKLHKRKKWAILVFHTAFIIALLGAFVTRYFGFEGTMLIREGKLSNTILTEKTYVDVNVDDGVNQFDNVLSKNVLFGSLSNNNFQIKNKFKEKKFRVQFDKLIPNAKLDFVEDQSQIAHLHIVVSTNKGREDLYIPNQSGVKYDNYTFTLNNPIVGGMNFTATGNELNFQPAQDGTYMEMQSRKTTAVHKDSIADLQKKHLYRFNDIGFVIVDSPKKGKKEYVTASKEEKNKYPNHALFLNINSGNESERILVLGAPNRISSPSRKTVNGLNFTINYGAHEKEIPFSVKLRDFELDRYPGSNSPSSYASEVTVMDKDKTFDYRIFMNHVLDYKGYRFFQSNYDPDEMGTHLSVNHDFWGTLLTYIAYFLMAFGMFFSLFIKDSRFRKLSNKLSQLAKNKALLLIVLISITGHVFGQEKDVSLAQYTVNQEHAAKFGRLLTQDYQGRIKPINTYALNVLRKVSKKDKYKDLTAEQVVLSAQVYPEFWETQKLLKISKTELGSKVIKELAIEKDYTSMSAMFIDDSYYLSDKVRAAHRKKDAEKNATDKEIIKLDEKVNIWWNLINGNLLKIYPKEGKTNNKWYAGTDRKSLVGKDTMLIKFHQLYINALRKAIKTNDYKDADEYLQMISKRQTDYGKAIIPSQKRIDFEILYNHSRVFFILLIYFFMVGAILFALAFVDLLQLFKSKKVKKLLNFALRLFSFLAFIGMLVHAAALGARWYISGHAPWSNSYETILFIAFATILAGILFARKKSKFILAVAILFAALLLGIAHGNAMNPEMTNLVPVLKSYWLMIHVAVIAGSYGFLGLGALLGFIVLLLYIVRTKENKKRVNNTINELTIVNELALTVGVYTLTIGTFLGGVWANESWGRYWGWDPKEVWSLISMMVYIFILHMRIVPGLKGKFTFNLLSMFSIATLIMTYFGVNYYLSGMHSYATGDPVPIQPWMYIAVVSFIVFAGISYWRYKSFNKK